MEWFAGCKLMGGTEEWMEQVEREMDDGACWRGVGCWMVQVVDCRGCDVVGWMLGPTGVLAAAIWWWAAKDEKGWLAQDERGIDGESGW